MKDLKTQVAAVVVENEETKLKLGEVELDCGEAVAKYKDLQEPKSEADMKSFRQFLGCKKRQAGDDL